MRGPPYNAKAPKQTVSVTLNSDLYGKAKSLGINASKVAEEALLTELRQDLAASEDYADQHGSAASWRAELLGAIDYLFFGI